MTSPTAYIKTHYNGKNVKVAALYGTKQTNAHIIDNDTSVTVPVKGHLCVKALNPSTNTAQTLYAPLVLENSPTADSRVVSLLHFDDTDNPFKDECGNIWTAYGSSVLTDDGYFYKALNISGGLTLNKPVNLLDSPFTLELWVYLMKRATSFVIGQHNYNSTNNEVEWYLYISINNLVPYFYFKSGKSAITTKASLGVWQHIAITRYDNSVYRLFVDGILKTSKTDTLIPANTIPLTIGVFNDNAYRLQGYIDEVRIIKGKCLYTEDFTPPTEPYTLDTVNGRR